MDFGFWILDFGLGTWRLGDLGTWGRRVLALSPSPPLLFPCLTLLTNQISRVDVFGESFAKNMRAVVFGDEEE
jgi:hypothetical protein